MISLKKALTAPALGAIIGMAVLSASSPAAARIVCNAEGDCWHTERAPVVPGIRFNIHPDDWYFHQHWDADREHHYRDYHEGRGYYKGGIWIPL
jgi:hypothetical protein